MWHTYISSVHSRKRCGQTVREDDKGKNERRIPVWGKSRGSPVAYVAICLNQIKGCEKLANLPHDEPQDLRFQIYSLTSATPRTSSVFKSSWRWQDLSLLSTGHFCCSQVMENSCFQYRKIHTFYIKMHFKSIGFMQILIRYNSGVACSSLQDRTRFVSRLEPNSLRMYLVFTNMMFYWHVPHSHW